MYILDILYREYLKRNYLGSNKNCLLKQEHNNYRLKSLLITRRNLKLKNYFTIE